jgi:hypothetical protein
MHSKHGAGVTESLKDSFAIFFILVGEISSTWVQPIENKYLVRCIPTREGENSRICVINLSEYWHFFDFLIIPHMTLFYWVDCSSSLLSLCCHSYLVVRILILDGCPQSFLCFCVIRDFAELLRGHFIYRWHTSDEENWAILTMVTVVLQLYVEQPVTPSPSLYLCNVFNGSCHRYAWGKHQICLSHSWQVLDRERSRVASLRS